ncbi:hypothetical protein ACFYZ9_33570 [Streptomyces sp. NPDC001691]|uniref:hypothetical protein n=1 Tax=Streptomyces sp. NPDC001691 TaxID=3364600 RepID=UPI0036A912B0
MTTAPDTGFSGLSLPTPRQASRPLHASHRPALPEALHVKRTARYVVNAGAEASTQACTVARALFSSVLGTPPSPESDLTIHRVLACLSELASIGTAHTHGDTLLCELWKDDEHVFVSVEHDTLWRATPQSRTSGLNLVTLIADDYGSHIAAGVCQTWAAIRIL